MIEYDGQTKCISEWCEIFGINVPAFRARLKMGWSIEKSLKQPLNGHLQKY